MPCYTLDNFPLRIGLQVKDLGVIFDPSLNFKPQNWLNLQPKLLVLLFNFHII